MGTQFEEVAMAYNKEVLEGVLRKDLGFTGVVVSDWCILEGFPESGEDALAAKAWGVEHLSLEQRITKALDAGVDQFGGETCIDALVSVVKSGKVPESRIDRSALKLLEEKFALGLFDQALVDDEAAALVVGKKEFVKAGQRAQADSIVMLTNKNSILPLKKGVKVYAEGFKSFPTAYGTPVSTPPSADVIIVRMQAPWTPMGKGDLARAFHHGSLEFQAKELEHIAELSNIAPVIIDLYCDRPVILSTLVDSASAITCNFGVREDILAAVLFGDIEVRGRLPFDLPRDMKAVEEKRIDVAFDSKDPVFRCGFGLRY